MAINTSLKSITISMIGCGPVGVSFLWQLRKLSQNFQKIKIYVFSKNTHASGYAYSTDNKDFLLNAQSSEMSIDPNLPNDFIDWLAVNEPAENNVLVSRNIFGKYLKNTFETLLNMRSNEFEINFITEEVIDCIVNTNNKVTVITKAHILETNFVVFCHGAINRDIYPELKNHEHFIYDFYQDISRLQEISENARILFLGSNLSMVDASLLLKENNRQYYITAASHSGYFPEIITHAKSPVNENIIDSNLNNLSDLINYINHNLGEKLGRDYNVLQEIEAYSTDLKGNQLLDHHYINANETSLIYQFSLKVDLAMDKIWENLSAKEKKMLSYIEKYFNRYLSGIPKQNYMKLIDFWCQSDFKGYKIENLSAFGHGFKAKFKDLKKIAHFDYVINCTGIEGIYQNTSVSELVKNIQDHHQIKINSKHGLQINPSTCNVYTNNQNEIIYQNVFAIGEAKIGSSHLCCDYAYHVKDAKKVVERINEYINLTSAYPN